MDPGRSFSGAVRAVARSEPGQVRTVGPLGGSWSAEDPAAFVAGGKSAWDWTTMICQPSWTTPEIIGTAVGQAAKKSPAALDRARSAPCREGPACRSCPSAPTAHRARCCIFGRCFHPWSRWWLRSDREHHMGAGDARCPAPSLGPARARAVSSPPGPCAPLARPGGVPGGSPTTAGAVGAPVGALAGFPAPRRRRSRRRRTARSMVARRGRTRGDRLLGWRRTHRNRPGLLGRPRRDAGR